jgi:hypothetical protein
VATAATGISLVKCQQGLELLTSRTGHGDTAVEEEEGKPTDIARPGVSPRGTKAEPFISVGVVVSRRRAPAGALSPPASTATDTFALGPT